jgi:hypothetical protein
MIAFKDINPNDVQRRQFNINPTLYFGSSSNPNLSGRDINNFYVHSGSNETGFYGEISFLINEYYYMLLNEMYGTDLEFDDDIFTIILPISTINNKLINTDLLIYSDQATAKTYVTNDDYKIYDQTDMDNHVGYFLANHGILAFTNYSASSSFVENMSMANTYVRVKSEQEIFEINVNCVIEPSEFNFTMNPSATYTSGSNQLYYLDGRLTYITTIGLYNDHNELIATTRLAHPLYNDPTQKLIIKTRIDL